MSNIERKSIYKTGDTYEISVHGLICHFSMRDFTERAEIIMKTIGALEGDLDEHEQMDLVDFVSGDMDAEGDNWSELGEYLERLKIATGFNIGEGVTSLNELKCKIEYAIFQTVWLDQQIKKGNIVAKFNDEITNFNYFYKESGKKVEFGWVESYEWEFPPYESN